MPTEACPASHGCVSLGGSLRVSVHRAGHLLSTSCQTPLMATLSLGFRPISQMWTQALGGEGGARGTAGLV